MEHHPDVRVVKYAHDHWRTEVRDSEGLWSITGPSHTTKHAAEESITPDFIKTQFEVMHHTMFMLKLDNEPSDNMCELVTALRTAADDIERMPHLRFDFVADAKFHPVGEWTIT